MSKHTKGPWEFHLGMDYACVMGPDQTTETALAQLYGASSKVEANGRLIAAAPDLLAALNAILHTYDNGGTPLGRAFEMANAAIAKATQP